MTTKSVNPTKLEVYQHDNNVLTSFLENSCIELSDEELAEVYGAWNRHHHHHHHHRYYSYHHRHHHRHYCD